MATHFGFEPSTERQYFFLSYNTEDTSRVAPIARALHNKNIPLWYDRGLIAGSGTWEQQLAEKIDSCQAMIMFITRGILKKSTDSFVRTEYKLAKVFSKKAIYIVLLDQIQLDEIPVSMRVWWLDLIANQCIKFDSNSNSDAQANEIIRNLSVQFNLLSLVYNNSPPKYSVDIVHCICKSLEMASILDSVKCAILSFDELIYNEFRKRERSLTQIRSRVISFRNYLNDQDNAMLVTDFFDLETQKQEFVACVNSMDTGNTVSGGSNTLEALAYALASKWSKNDTLKRQIIVLWTNTPTVPIGFYKQLPNYPKGMPSDIQSLEQWWAKKIDQNGKRLVIFGPEDNGNVLTALSKWNNTFCNSIALATQSNNRSAILSYLIPALE